MLKLEFDGPDKLTGKFLLTILECSICDGIMLLPYTDYKKCPYCWSPLPLYRQVSGDILARLEFYNKTNY